MKKNYRLIPILIASFMVISLLQFPAMGRETEAGELIQDSIQVYNTK